VAAANTADQAPVDGKSAAAPRAAVPAAVPVGAGAGGVGGGGYGATAPQRAANAAAVGNKPGKVGRNDPCPCGSGRKYKRCHGR
jgi:preprotein translocase subunit SecA